MSWIELLRADDHDLADDDVERPQRAPGRRTLTQRLPPSAASIAREVIVQMRSAGLAVQRQLGGQEQAPAPQLSNAEVAELLAALGRYDAGVDLPRARAALEQFRGMGDRDTADVLERLRALGQLSAVLDEQLTARERRDTLGRVDASLGVHFLVLDGVPDEAVDAQAEWARRSFAEDGVELAVLSRTRDRHAASRRMLATSGSARQADVNGTNEDGTPADPGAEANALLERAHRAGAARRRDNGPEAHAVFVPDLQRGRGVTIRPGWYQTAHPGVIIEAEAGTSTLAHELGHLCGLDHHPNDEGSLREGVQEPDDAGTRTMFPFEDNRGSEWSPQEIERIKRSVYVRLTPRVVPREEGPLRDEAPPPGPGRALSAPVQQRGAGPASGAPDDGHAIALGGVRDASAPLPHAEPIQRAFGRHDLGDVTAGVGGEAGRAAATLGASAYATGDRIAFVDAPDLFTAAHEAAHVIQQRQGVALDGGFGRAGDAYERHADAVAERVVSGQFVEELLGPTSGGAGGGGAVQLRLTAGQIERLKREAHAPGVFRGRWRRMSEEARGIVLEKIVQLYGQAFADTFVRYAEANRLRRGYFQVHRRPEGSPYPSFTGMGTMPHPREEDGVLVERRGTSEYWLHPCGLTIVISEPRHGRATAPPLVARWDDEAQLIPIIEEARRQRDAGDLAGARATLERGVPAAMHIGERNSMTGERSQVADAFRDLYEEIVNGGPRPPPTDEEILDEIAAEADAPPIEDPEFDAFFDELSDE